jgi:hypothetical protein
MFNEGASQFNDVGDLTTRVSISSQLHLFTPHEAMNTDK